MGLPTEILVEVAGHADYVTLKKLLDSSSAIRGLILRYLDSIIHQNLQYRYSFNTRVNQVVLTLADGMLEVIPSNTLDAVQEFDTRVVLRQQVLGSLFFDFPQVQVTGPDQTKQVLQFLSQGLAECDRIADIEAEVMLKYTRDAGFPTTLVSGKEVFTVEGRDHMASNWTTLMATIRHKQKQYIMNLPVKRIIILHAMMRACQGSYPRTTGMGDELGLAFHYGLAFAEEVLRRGTHYAWGHACKLGLKSPFPGDVLVSRRSLVSLVTDLHRDGVEYLLSYELGLNDNGIANTVGAGDGEGNENGLEGDDDSLFLHHTLLRRYEKLMDKDELETAEGKLGSLSLGIFWGLDELPM
ncbi:hypothetical protein MKZ38_003132 [Zalerion maritima]|uniref:Uncharacterized protein n=1 Tax=Zalerion maritima TaxID=339359 RepID=A0AAD5RX57_9PEZI|nr:hypothetical protein MKZ38_003132 [Zalerion maritima]